MLAALLVTAVIFYKIVYGMASWTVIGGFGALVFNLRGANEKTYERHVKWLEKSLSTRAAPDLILLAVAFAIVSLLVAPRCYLSVDTSENSRNVVGEELWFI